MRVAADARRPRASGLAAGKEVAVIEYPARSGGYTTRERLVLRESGKDYIRILYENDVRIVETTYGLVMKDLSSSIVAENLAVRLLTPFDALMGEDEVGSLRSAYLRRVVRRVVDDIIGTYELAATNLRIPPRYFLVKWIKSKLAILPHLSRLFWWLTPTDHVGESYLSRVSEGTKGVLEEACRDGLLMKDGDFYRICPLKSLKRVSLYKGLKSKGLVRPALTDLTRDPRLALDVLKLVLSDVQRIEADGLADLNPEDLLYIPTVRGLQPVSQDEPLIEALKSSLSLGDAEFRIERKGSLLNSTFLLKIYVDGQPRETLFVKKYLSWSDIKWIATKLWAMPLRNFYLMPGTRMGNEVFFLNYLRDRGFKVPEIIYISWKEKALVENAIDAITLTEAWTKMRRGLADEVLEKVTMDVGMLLAEIHSAGVVLGDCKPDNFLTRPETGEFWVVDLEQASLRGGQSWDLSELILYMGHYLSGEDAARYAALITQGYLEAGRREVVEKVLNSAFHIVMLPWSPIWTQVSMFRAVSNKLKQAG